MRPRLAPSLSPVAADSGFTLIELLTVIVVMGVLIAIGMPLYSGIQDSSTKDSARSALRATNQAVEAYYTDEGTFDGISATVLKADYEPSIHPYSTGTTYDNPVAIVSTNDGDSFVLCSKVKTWWAYKEGPADDIHYTTTTSDLPTECPIP